MGERREAEKGKDASVGGMRGETRRGGTEGRNESGGRKTFEKWQREEM